MEHLAIGSIDYALTEVERLHKNATSIEVKNTIDDSLFHLRRAKEALVDGLKNPKEWVQESEETIKTFYAMIPFLLLMRDQNLSKQRASRVPSSYSSSPAKSLDP